MVMKFSGELNKAVKMYTFLKRQKGSTKHLKGRFINLFLATCQIVGPIVLQTSLIIVITQEPVLSQITKAFVTLGFVVGIDDMFASTLPEAASDNVEKLNEKSPLILKKDYNTFN